jgi:hypothetical protein
MICASFGWRRIVHGRTTRTLALFVTCPSLKLHKVYFAQISPLRVLDPVQTEGRVRRGQKKVSDAEVSIGRGLPVGAKQDNMAR